MFRRELTVEFAWIACMMLGSVCLGYSVSLIDKEIEAKTIDFELLWAYLFTMIFFVVGVALA